MRTPGRKGAARLARWFVLWVGAMAAGAPSLAAQEAAGTGRIVGRVVDEQTAKTLQLAQVSVEGTSLSTVTNVEGRYRLAAVPAGTHAVVVEIFGYAKKTVTGVVVRAGEVTTLDVGVAPEAIALEAITVSVEAEGSSTAALLAERRKAPIVMDAIGADQIAKSPDSDAATALKRVPGVSVVDGKYVYVRGLGERYGQATLDGAPLPSTEPDKKVVPLDIIPANFLESIATAKTYAPNQPADYAGGLVEIETQDFPAQSLFTIGGSLGYNSGASFETGLGYPGGGLDFLGVDDGTRDLPAAIPRDRALTETNFTEAELEQIGESFDPAWGPVSNDLPVNNSFALAFGDDVTLAGNPFGFIGSFAYSNDWNNTDDLIERVFTTRGAVDPELDYTGDASWQEVKIGGLLNLAYELSPTNRLKLSGVLNRITDDEARILEGFNLDSNTDQRNTRIRYIERSLVNTQLEGEHLLTGIANTSFQWRASYAFGSRYEPNTREVLYRQAPDGRFLFDTFVQSGSIFHQDLNDDIYSGALDLSVPFMIRSLPASLDFGGSAQIWDRSTFTRRFRFLPTGGLGAEVRELAPDELFAPENIAPDSFQIQEATFREDNYTGEQKIFAGYAMLDAELLPRLRFLGGARIEAATQEVQSIDLFDTGQEPLPPATLDDTDLVPGINLTYALSNAMNLRGAYSRTIGRPQFRELAPFAFADFAGGYLVTGNPALNRSRIANWDLRWEWFPEVGSVLAVSGFYKKFDDPIETMVFPSTEQILTWVNADQAENYGFELEARTSLGVIGNALRNLYLNANLTVVESNVTAGDEVVVYVPGFGPDTLAVVPVDRALQGQSPYVFNAGLTWVIPSTNTSATVLYNIFGRRIDAVGAQALDDIYEEDRGQLDLTVRTQISRRFDVKFSIERLTGSLNVYSQGDDVLRSNDLGRKFSFGITWAVGGGGFDRLPEQ